MNDFSTTDIKQLLDEEARRINNLTFIDKDPVQFPRRFERLQDIEIVSLLCATIAWGNRKMICSNCEKLLSIMEYRPLDYILDEGYEELPEGNIHRTFFASNLQHYMRGLRQIYRQHGSLQNFAGEKGVQHSDYPSWHLVAAMNEALAEANNGQSDSRCLPLNLETTALKRINMALRWLVRNDGIVDLGVWDILSPSQLFIPLDVHVGNTARELGLVNRRANDRRTTIELTHVLRQFNPEDPVIYDYALFGMGLKL